LKLLILGGTTEASALARRLAGDARFDAMLSLAGRTRAPLTPAIPFRIGGFGGAAGLAAFLAEQKIAALVDATHPFAQNISENARIAAGAAGIPVLAVVRPEWVRGEGDQWVDVATMTQAAAALGEVPRRVFLTVGQQDLAAFAGTPHRYVVRSVDLPPPGLLQGADFLAARGPFLLRDEIDRLQGRKIEFLVTKNSGGSATSAKLEAARYCGVQVVMVARPPPPDVPQVTDDAAALAWLERVHGGRSP
jgi:precorrin-6A/cobalt-precorrin-6A reductase